MPSYLPDADRDGSWNLIIPNGSNKTARLGLQSGSTPKTQWRTAGFGAQIVAADGTTVILDVPETGFIPSTTFSQLIPQASKPVGITEGGIWYSSVDHSFHGVDNTATDLVFLTSPA